MAAVHVHPRSQREGVPTLPGHRYRSTHQASVDAILGPRVREVFSRGSHFLNHDSWRLRSFIILLCAWASRHPKGKPQRSDIEAMIRKVNDERVPNPHIVIAATPEELPFTLGMALIGGAYHEAWHTKYSRRGVVRVNEVWPIVDAVWGRIPNWSKLGQSLLAWSNISEDVRIERCGNRDYPGAESKMHDLQHFILDMEEASRNEAISKGASIEDCFQTHSVVSLVFRDIGLGYNTGRQRRAMAEYQKYNQMACLFVTNGPFADLLRENMTLGPDDDIACLKIAMEAMAILSENSQAKEDDAKGKSGDAQQGGEAHCPNCGSPNVTVVRLKSDKKKGKLVCGKCGYTEEVEISEDGKGQKAKDGGTKGDEGEDGDGKGSQGDKDSKKDGSKGGGKGDDRKGSEDDSGDGGENGDEEGDDGGNGDEEGDEDGEGEAEGGGQGDGDASGGAEGDGEGEGEDESRSDKDGKGDGKGSGRGAGGPGFHDEDLAEAWGVVALGFLENAEAGVDTGLKDGNQAFEDAVEQVRDREDARTRQGTPYRPYDPSLDVVEFVKPSKKGQGYDERRANELLGQVRSECSYLRARLRTIVKAVMQRGIDHGVRRGRGLSERMFVDDVCALRAGAMPERPDYDVEDEIDVSASVCVVLDESSSMRDRLQLATLMLIALTEPMDGLQFPTMAIGFRDGKNTGDVPPDEHGKGYKFHGACIDVFKAFHEPFRSVRWRFANTRATATTPMADGIQYGLEALQERTEDHRIMFVITDGHPNGDHKPFIQWQLERARAAGILIVGVGIGSGASYVSTLFPDSVYSRTVSELPVKLVSKLNDLLDFRSGGRGRRSAVPRVMSR